MIRLVNDFEGANPSAPEAIQLLDQHRARIQPYSEDGDANYKFCLNVKVVNDSHLPQPLQLEIDWDDTQYMEVRDYLLIGWGDNWRVIQGKVEGDTTHLEVSVEPGEWYLALHPVYDLERFSSDRRTAREGGFSEEVIGRSLQGRDIVTLTIGAEATDDIPTILIVSRYHPYETAGSFCTSGIVQMLIDELRAGGAMMNENRFVLLPMPNPDGVATGCCKRTGAGGPDLCHEALTSNDPAARALANLIERTKPNVYLDFHGWMYRNHDGLNYTHPDQREAFVRKLADDPLFSKEWKGVDLSSRQEKEGDVCSYLFHRFGTECLVMSFSWFGRTVPQMREIGRRVLNAVCEILRGV